MEWEKIITFNYEINANVKSIPSKVILDISSNINSLYLVFS
jgi:hypothetical protein